VILGRIDVDTVGILNAAPVAEVIVIIVCTLGHNVVTDIALVILVSVNALGDGETANVTFVIYGINVYAIVCLRTAPVTCMILGRIDVDTVRILNATPVAEVIVIIVCTLGHNVVTDIALVVLIFVDTLCGGKTANVTFVVSRINVYAIVCLRTAPVTCMILGRIGVDTVRILYVAPVAEMIVIGVFTL
jgi:hypothetical protein